MRAVAQGQATDQVRAAAKGQEMTAETAGQEALELATEVAAMGVMVLAGEALGNSAFGEMEMVAAVTGMTGPMGAGETAH